LFVNRVPAHMTVKGPVVRSPRIPSEQPDFVAVRRAKGLNEELRVLRGHEGRID
jgi:hypothetical protein